MLKNAMVLIGFGLFIGGLAGWCWQLAAVTAGGLLLIVAITAHYRGGGVDKQGD